MKLSFVSFLLAVPSASTVYSYHTVSYVDVVAAMVHSTEQEQRYFKILFLFPLRTVLLCVRVCMCVRMGAYVCVPSGTKAGGLQLNPQSARAVQQH